MKYIIHKNGTYDLLGSSFSFIQCSPFINGSPVSAEAVKTGEDYIQYTISDRQELCISFKGSGQGLELQTDLSDAEGVIDLCPLVCGRLQGAEEAFCQGFGMEGPSGVSRIGQEDLSSNGLIVLMSGQKALLLYTRDHRQYMNRFAVSGQASLFGQDPVSIFSGGTYLEGARKGPVSLPLIFIREMDCLNEALSSAAAEIRAEMGARHDKGNAFHWCSWYYLYQFLDMPTLKDYLSGMRKEEVDFKYVQIDSGYARNQGDWLIPSELFPDGLQAAAEKILEAGFKPGIWVAPFMVGSMSRLARDHEDWLLHNHDGSLYVQMTSYNEPKAFGRPDGEYYVLDVSHPDALAYLADVFRTFRSWGFELFKTDFMLWNMHGTDTVERYDKTRTSVEIFRDLLSVIRKEIGEESYLLGCIAPFLPFIGYADGMRIAGDIGAQWAGDYGPQNLLRELTADSYFNNVYWQNDPDSVMLRDFDIHLNDTEIESLALMAAMSGGVITTSEPVHRLSRERRKLLDFIHPGKEKHSPYVPFPGAKRQDLILCHSLKKGKLFFALNMKDEPCNMIYDLGDFFSFSDTEPVYYKRFGENEIKKGQRVAECLAGHEALLLFISSEPLSEDPKNIWAFE